MILIYIPARGGSKGLPLKNLQSLLGKPLIQYTLDIVRGIIGYYGNWIIPFISSDDEQVLAFCRSYGFEIEYRRPASLSGDHATIVDGVLDALEWLKNEKGTIPTTVLLLQPTSPIRSVTELKELIDRFSNEKQVSMFSVIPMKQHPYECLWIEGDKWDYLQKPVLGQQRQLYKDNFYFIDGSYYMATPRFLIEQRTFVVSNVSIPFPLKDKYIIDIDEKMDLLLAETIIKNRGKQSDVK